MNLAERIAVEAIAHFPGLPEAARELLLRLAEGGAARQSPANDTPAEGAGPLSSTERSRRRRATQRALHATANATDATLHATANATLVAPPNPPREPLSSPDSLSISEERESETRVKSVAATRDATRNATENATRCIRRTDPLPPELREMASGATGAPPVRDIDGAWLKFVGHWDGRIPPSLSGEWQKWCVNEARREQSERTRGGPSRVQPAPPGGRLYAIGDEKGPGT